MKEDSTEKQASGFSLEKFRSKRGAETVKAATSSPRKPFKVEWVKLPRAWWVALQHAKSAATLILAQDILFAAFNKRHGGEIILSTKLTKLPDRTRRRAVRELVKLGLIRLHRENSGQAYRIAVKRDPTSEYLLGVFRSRK
jgi:hypothetical protein